MSDPIDKLTRLGDALEGAPMPLPASAIRARGDRIRRRRHAVIAGASAAVVAAVAIPVVAFTVGDGEKDPGFTPSPSVSDPVQPGAIGPSNLVTSEDAIYPTGGTVDWQERMTFEGDGQAPYSPCMETSMGGLGAESVWRRDFSFVITESNEVDPANRLNEVIAEFPSATEAEAAYAEIKGWYDDCLPAGADRFDAETFAPVPIDVDGTAEAQLSIYGPVDDEIDPFGDLGYLLETGLVLSGDRIAVVSQTIIGQDYNFDIDRRPVVQMLPAAAERLVLGGGGQVDPTDPTAVGGDWVTDIPDGFTILDGSTDEGSDAQALVPAGDLDGCGQAVETVEAEDRLTQRLTVGSTSYARELQLFSDADEAARYWDSVQDAFSSCEASSGAYSVESSGGSVALLWSAGEDRSVAIATRNRNAVLVAVESDDLGSDVAAVGRMWVGVAEGLSPITQAIDALVSGRTTPEPDLGEPAGTVEIPADLPLDTDMVDMGSDGDQAPPSS